MPSYYVSRQQYFGVEKDERYCVEIATGGRDFADADERYCVEIAIGGRDFANADELCNQYPGEGCEYKDPREAVQVALAIADAWAKELPSEKINVGAGYTGGMSLPFEGQEKEALMAWAEKRYTLLEKCPSCGEIMEGAREWYQAGNWISGEFLPYNDGEKYCSERCAEKASTYSCQNSECTESYFWEDRGKLSETQEGLLCPICRMTPCNICGLTADNHDYLEDDPTGTGTHRFEAPDWVVDPTGVQVWDNHGDFDRDTPDGLRIDETFDRFTAVFPDQTYVAMSESPFHPQGCGQHGEAIGYTIYDPETWIDSQGNTVSHLGKKIELSDLPADCLKLVLHDCTTPN